MNNVLVLAPHIDDESLGCGATISKFVEEGKTVRVVAFSKAGISLPDGFTEDDITNEFFEALKILGCHGNICNYPTRDFDLNRQDILDTMIYMKEQENPDLVICPSLNDMHQDHQVIAQEAARAFWNTTILSFESVRKCKRFEATAFIRTSFQQMTRKLEAVQCYKSQIEKEFFPGDPSCLLNQGRLRGLQAGSQFAEAYEVIQWMV